ncbi:MAG TPA: branched-chain amino acid ABC transporter substrate-binding protein [Methylomirabilota bacterium]|nr:branched-chain amino acid ABC transporter substrate-binding protein [Methylomirabilota bacterium]
MDKQQQNTPIQPTTSEQQAEKLVQSGASSANQNKSSTAWIIGVVILIVIVGSLGGYIWMQRKAEQAKLEKPTAKIGVMLPFSGGTSTAGYGILKGVELAKKQLGATNIQLIQEDSKCDPAIAAQAVKNLVDKGVVAIIGEACSSATLKALPAANKYHVPLLSPASSSPQLSQKGDYFFRVVPPDQYQGEFVAKLLYNQKHLRTAAILHSDEAYGNDLAGTFTKSFEALGGKVLTNQSFETGAISLQQQVNAIKVTNPQAVYLISNSAPPAASALQLLYAAGVHVPMYGGDSLYDGVIASTAKQAAEGFTVTSFSIGTKAFRQALADSSSSSGLTVNAPEGYDAFHAIYAALQKGATTGEEVKNILPSIEFDGVSGHIKFDEYGEVSQNYNYTTLELKDGDFVPVEQ